MITTQEILQSKKTYDKSRNNSNEILKTKNNNKTNRLNDDWIVNLSSLQFNQIQMSVLKLDPKFQVSPIKVPIERILSKIESKIHYNTNIQEKI